MNQSLESYYKIKKEYLKFLSNFRSLELSTIGENGTPEISYAPFVFDEKNNFYIYVSSLSSHTKNLFNDKRAGVMLIEAEEQAESIFSRKRILFDCRVDSIKKQSIKWNIIMKKFGQSFGEIFETLSLLPDFYLFCLKPKTGRFIKGFGMAYQISGKKMNELSHIKPK